MHKDWHNLKNRFNDYQSPIELDEAWSALELRRNYNSDTTSQRKKYLWLLFISAVLVCSFGLYNWYYFTPTEVDSQANKLKLTETTSNKLAIINQKNIAADADAKAESKVILSNQSKENPAVNESSKLIDSFNSSVSNSTQKTKPISINSFSLTENKNEKRDQVKNENVKSNIGENVALIFESGNLMKKKEQEIKTAHFKIEKEVDINSHDKYPLMSEVKPQLKITRLENIVSFCSFDGERNLMGLANFDFQMQQQASVKRNKSTVGFSFSYGLNMKNLEATLAASQEWVDKRNSLENSKDYLSLGFAYKKYLTQNIFLGAGIQYTRWMDKLTYTYSTTTIKTYNNVVVERKYLSDGSIDEMLGSVEGEETQEFFATLWQKQDYLSIPITIGSDFSFDETSGIRASLGVQIPVYRAINGSTVPKELSLEEVEKINPLDFKKNGPLQGLVNLTYFQGLGQNAQCYFGVNTSFDLGSRIISSESYSQKHMGIGLKAGVLRSF